MWSGNHTLCKLPVRIIFEIARRVLAEHRHFLRGFDRSETHHEGHLPAAIEMRKSPSIKSAELQGHVTRSWIRLALKAGPQSCAFWSPGFCPGPMRGHASSTRHEYPASRPRPACRSSKIILPFRNRLSHSGFSRRRIGRVLTARFIPAASTGGRNASSGAFARHLFALFVLPARQVTVDCHSNPSVLGSPV